MYIMCRCRVGIGGVNRGIWVADGHVEGFYTGTLYVGCTLCVGMCRTYRGSYQGVNMGVYVNMLRKAILNNKEM